MSHVLQEPTRRGEWVLVFVVAFVVALLARVFGVQTFEVTSSSMENTLLVGDRVLVDKASPRWREFQRGDIVVFDGAGSFVPQRLTESNPLARIASAIGNSFGLGSSAQEVFVKRIVGLPGDKVRCCAPDGSLLLNGAVLAEPYLFPGDAASDVAFDVVVPQGKVWLLGDHRAVSSDSRAHLGSPGGGMVPEKNIIGLARYTIWPRDRMGSLTLERVP